MINAIFSRTRLVVLGTLAVAFAGACSSGQEQERDSSISIYRGERVRYSRKTAAKAIERATVLIWNAPYNSCSGTLITPTIVVTAAHCFGLGIESPEVRFPLAGNKSIAVKKKDIIKHHSFTMNAREDADILVIRLRKTAPSPYKPAYLPTSDSVVQGIRRGRRSVDSRGQKLILAGYGDTGDTQENEDYHLYMAEMELFRADASAKRLITSDDRSATCEGDSGGPAFVYQGGKLILLGVLSKGTCEGQTFRKTGGALSRIFGGRIRPYMSVLPSTKGYRQWILGKLTRKERKRVKSARVRFTAATEVREERETIDILKMIDALLRGE